MNDFLEHLAWGFASGILWEVIGWCLATLVGVILLIICVPRNNETNNLQSDSDLDDDSELEQSQIRVSPRTRSRGPPDDDGDEGEDYHTAC